MLKVSEARIGNFLLFDFPDRGKVQYRAERINNDFDGLHAFASINGLALEKITAIPISDIWLAKLGFQKVQKRHQQNWIIKLKDSSQFYSVQFSEDRYWLSNSEYDAWCYVIRDIEWVHELQNLFFALTGEELVVIE